MDIFKEIIDWTVGLPTWQQEAVRLLLENGEITPGDLADLVARVKSDDDSEVVVAIPSPQPMGSTAVALTSLEHICGVNALAEGQKLEFLGPAGLTVIYGENASGKSGYSRILKHACRSREKKPDPIQGDVYRQGACPTPKAKFTYLDDGKAQSEDWTAGCSTSEALRTVALFDASCSRLYVEKDGDLAFQPYGLEVFKQLGDAATAVKDAVTAEADAISVPTFPSFTHPSVVEAVNGVLAKNNETTRAKVENLATLSAAETKRADALQTQIAQLETSDPKKLAQGCRKLATKVETTNRTIGAAATRTTEQLKLAPDAMKERDATAKLAAEASKVAFEKELVRGVGTDPWKRMFEYARAFSVGIAYPDKPFPNLEDGAFCVLCHQPLTDAEVKKRMTRFAEFVSNKAEEDAKAALSAYQTVRTTIIDTAKTVAGIEDALIDQVEGSSEAAAKELRGAKAGFEGLRTSAEEADTEAAWKKLKPPSTRTQELTKLGAKLRADAAEYEKNSNEEERRKLKAELDLLRDRQQLAKQREAILKAAVLAARKRRLSKRAADIKTRRITDKGGEITERVLTPELRKTLNAELRALGAAHLKVEYVRRGRVGEQRHYLKLSKAPDGTNVGDILSEGEHRCLGIAAFLTELGQAGHTSGIVLDDPVSSLDHRHREAVARRLAEAAKTRQVIILTHDLAFLGALWDAAVDLRVALERRAVAKTPEGAGVPVVGLFPKSMPLSDLIAHIKDDAAAISAMDESDLDRRGRVEHCYGHLRVAWERVVEEVVLYKVVSRFSSDVMTKRLKGVVQLTEKEYGVVFSAVRRISGVIDAHSSAAGGGPPRFVPNEEIAREVAQLDEFFSTAKQRANTRAKAFEACEQPPQAASN